MEVVKKVEGEEMKGGELLFCGAVEEGSNFVSPTRLRSLVDVNIRFVASGCVSSHCVALDVHGRCYTWGKNEMGQLGHGDTVTRDLPFVVSELVSKHTIITAGVGRKHTVVVTEDGSSLAFGWNTSGQLGSGSEHEMEQSPVTCLVSNVKDTACGAEFTVWLTSTAGATIQTAGLAVDGQLGHNCTTSTQATVSDSEDVVNINRRTGEAEKGV